MANSNINESLQNDFIIDIQETETARLKKNIPTKEEQTLSTQTKYDDMILDKALALSSTNDDDLPVVKAKKSEIRNSTHNTNLMSEESIVHIRDAFIRKYRTLKTDVDVISALEEIKGEVVPPNDHIPVLDIDQDRTQIKLTAGLTNTIREEFDKVLSLLSFSKNIDIITENLIVDGIIVTELIFDNENIEEGIKNIRYMNPIGFYRTTTTQETEDDSFDDEVLVVPCYKYIKDDNGVNNSYIDDGYYNNYYDDEIKQKADECYKVSQIATATLQTTISYGDNNNGLEYEIPVGYLHPIIKYVEGKKNIELSLSLYRYLYAFPRYAFSVPLGKMNIRKSYNYINSVKAELKDDIDFDPETFSIRSISNLETIRNHYVFPTRNGEKVDVENVTGGDSGFLKDMEDLSYFMRKIYKGLGVPTIRLDESNSFDFTATEILMQEKKFSKRINKIKSSITHWLLQILKRQLVSKKVVTLDEWESIKEGLSVSITTYSEYEQQLKNYERDKLIEGVENFSSFKESGVILGDNAILSLERTMKVLFDMNETEVEEELKRIEEERTKKYTSFYKSDEGEEDGGGSKKRRW